MKCNEFEKIVSLYIDDRVSETEASSIGTHLEVCARCRETLKKYRMVNAAVAGIPIVSKQAPVFTPVRKPASQPAFQFLTPFRLAAALTIFVLAVCAALFLPGGLLDHNGKPPATPVGVNPTVLQEMTRIEREVALNDSRYVIRVEGQDAELIYMSIDEGPDKSIEMDYSDFNNEM